MNTLQIFQAIAAQLGRRKDRALAGDGSVLKGIEDEVVGAVMREARGRTNPAFVRSLVSACLDDDPSAWPADLARVARLEAAQEAVQLQSQLEDAKKALAQLEAATQLCARGQAFWLIDQTGAPQLCLGFIDLFAPGPDSESVGLDQAQEILAEFYARGRRGLLEWVARRRGQPIRPGVLDRQKL